MHNFTYFSFSFLKESTILLSAYYLLFLLLTIHQLIFFLKSTTSKKLFNVSLILKGGRLQISSLNFKFNYWFLSQNRLLPSQGNSMLYLLAEHTIFRRKELFT